MVRDVRSPRRRTTGPGWLRPSYWSACGNPKSRALFPSAVSRLNAPDAYHATSAHLDIEPTAKSRRDRVLGAFRTYRPEPVT